MLPTDFEKFLITGASGQLGFELHRQLSSGEENQSLPKTRDTLDVADFDRVYSWLKAARPDAIVNCAGYTDVAKAETDQQTCWRVNVCGVNSLACCASSLDIPMIHISTDFVFGREFPRRNPYKESDPVSPINFYGHSKANGEHALLRWAAVRPNFSWWVIRCAGLFERPWRHRRNFPSAIKQALECRSQKVVEVVHDVTTNLTYAPHLAKVICWFLQHREQIPSGIYHVTNEGECRWHEVAAYIARGTGRGTKLRPVTRREYASHQCRDLCTMPSFTCLSGERYRKLGGPVMPPWQDAVNEWLRPRKESRSLAVA